jgi:hypothetical protein
MSANFARSILQFLVPLLIPLRNATAACFKSHVDLFLITPLSAFFNRKLDIAKSITFPDDHGNQIPCADPDSEPFDDSMPLVFTHQDLTMRNIILGKDGKIWLVDWGMSGFYPLWFEHVTMVYAAERCTTSVSWNHLIPFITDPLFKHMKWMDQIGFALIAYR